MVCMVGGWGRLGVGVCWEWIWLWVDGCCFHVKCAPSEMCPWTDSKYNL